MEWLVRLEGDIWSLEDLPGLYSQLDHKVRLEDDKYYLTSMKFAHCANSSEVIELAMQIVEWINASVKAFKPHYHPVQVGSEIVEVDDAGTRRVHQQLRPPTGEVRVKGYAPTVLSGVEPTAPQPSKPEQLLAMLEKASATSSLPRVLDAWLLPTVWQRLRYVCDVIRDDVAHDPNDLKRSWTRLAREMAPLMGIKEDLLNHQLVRFNKTAVKPEHAGSYALHGYMTGPTANPMLLPEAEDFVHDLLVAWLIGKVLSN